MSYYSDITELYKLPEAEREIKKKELLQEFIDKIWSESQKDMKQVERSNLDYGFHKGVMSACRIITEKIKELHLL